MYFPMPTFPCGFDLPDEWLAAAGLIGFRPSAPSFRSSPIAVLIALHDIEPPIRSPGVPLDHLGFGRDRMIAVLRGIVQGDEIPPVPVRVFPDEPFWNARPFSYRPRDGMHRYYASVAAGYEMLPVAIT